MKEIDPQKLIQTSYAVGDIDDNSRNLSKYQALITGWFQKKISDEISHLKAAQGHALPLHMLPDNKRIVLIKGEMEYYEPKKGEMRLRPGDSIHNDTPLHSYLMPLTNCSLYCYCPNED